MLHRRHVLAGGALLAARPAQAQPLAQPFPQRPLRLVVSSAPGASLDALARILAPTLAARFGQPVIVENQGGAGGVVAMSQVARAAPDGHALLIIGDTIMLAEHLARENGPGLRDFAPVTLAVQASQILVTHPGTGIRTVQDYVARVRAAPGRINMGLPGWGGIAHLVNEMLNRQLDLRVEYIPYRGGAPAALDLLARQVDAIVITLPAVTEHVREGRLIGLAVTTAARDAALPDVPTLAETVAPGFDLESLQGVLAPAGTPPAVTARLHEAIAETLATPEIRTRLGDLGYTVVAAPPDAFAQRLGILSQRLGAAIREAGITAER